MTASLLHMETEAVRATAQQITRVTEDIRTQAASLLGSVQSMGWVSPGRDAFVAEMESLMQALNAQADAGTSLAQRAEREVAEWEDAASRLGGTAAAGAGVGSMAGGAAAVLGINAVSVLPATGVTPTSKKVLVQEISDLESQQKALEQQINQKVGTRTAQELQDDIDYLTKTKGDAQAQMQQILNGRKFEDLSKDEQNAVTSLRNLSAQSDKFIGANQEKLNLLNQYEQNKANLAQAQANYSQLTSPAGISDVQKTIQQGMNRLPNESPEQCAVWAQKRGESLGWNPGHIPPDANKESGAGQYINLYKSSQIDAKSTPVPDLINATEPGSALVWEPSTGGAGRLGHVAIVEHVQQDGIWISNSNYDSDGNKTLDVSDGVIFLTWDRVQKKSLHIIPTGSTRG